MTQATQIVCIGSILWDIIGRSSKKLTRSDDIEGHIEKLPGGVTMNLATRLRSHGIIPSILSALGDDSAGKELIKVCEQAGIICKSIIIKPGSKTDYYMAIEDKTGVALAVADTTLLKSAKDAVLDPLLVGDYKDWKGPIAVDSNLSPAVLKILRHNERFKVSDFRLAPASPSKVTRLKIFLDHPGANIYLNLKEANLISEMQFDTSKEAATALLSNGLKTILITDGPNAACLASKSEIIELQPPRVKVKRLTGAGDVLMASHIAKVLKGEDNFVAFKYAIEQTSKFISEDPINETN